MSPASRQTDGSSPSLGVRGAGELLTSESVTEGHPDKLCDLIADTVLDAHLAVDPHARVACEALAKGDRVVLAGEITSPATVDYQELVRRVLRETGATAPNPSTVQVELHLSEQSPEIARGVTGTGAALEQGAGDQGMMIGYASDETPELMPLPILLAHRLARELARQRREGGVGWLRADGKSLVTASYEEGRPVRVEHVLVSTQHAEGTAPEAIAAFVRDELVPAALGSWWREDLPVLANPAGSFVLGGSAADSGLSGRKNVVDSYGGAVPHGGGSLSGKDPSKVDRSGAYFCRYVARQVVLEGLARRVQVRVAYAIGVARPLGVAVDTFGTGDEDRVRSFVREFDFRPGAIIERLDLLRPIYARTAVYGHFGRPGFPWED
jgi:S-adenosylmethionine synthetase